MGGQTVQGPPRPAAGGGGRLRPGVHLAAYSPITPIFEMAPSEVYWSPLRQALQELFFPIVDGAVALPERPGIGIELPAELVEHFILAPEKGWRYHEDQD